MDRIPWRALAAGACAIALSAGRGEAAAPPAPPTLIHAGQLLKTPGQAPLDQVTVVVVDGKVQSVRPGFISPEAAGLPASVRVVDLSKMFVMPGFIDLHVHLAGAGGGDALVRKSDEYFTLLG